MHPPAIHRASLWARLSLARQFLVASVLVLICGMTGIGWWVSGQIIEGVTHRTASTAALYVNSVLAPVVQGLVADGADVETRAAELDRLFNDTPLGKRIVAFKIWSLDSRVLYSTRPEQIGLVFPATPLLANAVDGQVGTELSSLEDEEDSLERGHGKALLETYTPVRVLGGDRIIAVAEFYEVADDLLASLRVARVKTWLVVAGVTLAMLTLLAGIVRGGSQTIERQKAELQERIAELSSLLIQNESLHRRVRQAGLRTASLNERYLRRVSGELHDGPAQALSLALLRMETLLPVARRAVGGGGAIADTRADDDIHVIESTLRDALDEIRYICAGLTLPELGALDLVDVLKRAIRAHERRTATRVDQVFEGLPANAALPVKIAVFRIVQEALSNAFRHAGGVGQQVHAECHDGWLRLLVGDEGPGFDPDAVTQSGDFGHLGLAAMRERAGSLSGTMEVVSAPGQGTRIEVRLPVNAGTGDD